MCIVHMTSCFLFLQPNKTKKDSISIVIVDIFIRELVDCCPDSYRDDLMVRLLKLFDSQTCYLFPL